MNKELQNLYVGNDAVQPLFDVIHRDELVDLADRNCCIEQLVADHLFKDEARKKLTIIL